MRGDAKGIGSGLRLGIYVFKDAEIVDYAAGYPGRFMKWRSEGAEVPVDSGRTR